jgi:glucose dehydrogenase
VGGRTEQRILIATGIGELIALDARSGQPIASFGKDGRVDLQAALIHKEEDRRFVGSMRHR